MNSRVFVGAERVAAVPLDDRGLAYGDGLFETMRAHAGRVHWWARHWTRLAAGAARLALPLPEESCVRAQAESLLQGGDGVLKLLVTRGSGGRGYGPPAQPVPTWVLSRHALPPRYPADGVMVRWCETPLAVQPLLAGLKHCNRLEQVLARAELQALSAADAAPTMPEADEGLMLDTEGQVVCATAANLFLLSDGRWHTPAVDRSGVAGICRGWAMEATGATEARVDRPAVEAADAVFLCNAVRGILPVSRLGERTWALHPRVAALRQRLAADHPAFATEFS